MLFRCHPMEEWSEGGGYSPGAPSVLTQIVPYLSSLFTVFHSVIYNSEVYPLLSRPFNSCYLLYHLLYVVLSTVLLYSLFWGGST